MREAAVMLIIKDGLIMGVSRGLGSKLFGLPGGKVEDGETPIDAAIREVKEEAGLKVTSCSFIHKRVEPAHKPDGIDFNAYCFYADSWEGEPTGSHEGDVKWVTKEELAQGSFPEYNMNALTILQEMHPTIFIK